MSITLRRCVLLLALLAVTILPARAELEMRIAAIGLAAAPTQMHAYRDHEVIVAFRKDIDTSLVSRAIRDVRGVSARRTLGGHYVVTLEPGVSVPEAVRQFRGMPAVDYAEPNGYMRAFFDPNDRGYKYQWNFKLLNSARTWDIQKGDASVVVAIVDTGIAFEDFGKFRKAPDWGSTVFVPGFNVYDGTSHANDDNFHGTHVASTVAEGTDNSDGVAGFAFKCALMPVKVLDDTGRGTFDDVATGITWAADHGAKVINLSLGGEDDSETVRRAVNQAFAKGSLLVAAAGNDGLGTISFPAALPNVMAVGAVDGRKQLAPYSNFGPQLSVVAPGGDLDRDDDFDGFPDGILQQTLDPITARDSKRYDDFGYFFVVGTSEATPHVSALAALLIRQGITDPASIRAAIEQTAEDLGAAGRDDTYGHGLIRPVLALSGLGINE
jgi:serine protease